MSTVKNVMEQINSEPAGQLCARLPVVGSLLADPLVHQLLGLSEGEVTHGGLIVRDRSR